MLCPRRARRSIIEPEGDSVVVGSVFGRRNRGSRSFHVPPARPPFPRRWRVVGRGPRFAQRDPAQWPADHRTDTGRNRHRSEDRQHDHQRHRRRRAAAADIGGDRVRRPHRLPLGRGAAQGTAGDLQRGHEGGGRCSSALHRATEDAQRGAPVTRSCAPVGRSPRTHSRSRLRQPPPRGGDHFSQGGRWRVLPGRKSFDQGRELEDSVFAKPGAAGCREGAGCAGARHHRG